MEASLVVDRAMREGKVPLCTSGHRWIKLDDFAYRLVSNNNSVSVPCAVHATAAGTLRRFHTVHFSNEPFTHRFDGRDKLLT